MVLSISIAGKDATALDDGPHIIMCNNDELVPSSEYHGVITDPLFQVYAHRELIKVKRCVAAEDDGDEHAYTIFFSFSFNIEDEPTDFYMVFVNDDLGSRDDEKPLVDESVSQIEVWGAFEENAGDCDIVLQNVCAGQFDAETLLNDGGYYKTIRVSNGQPVASDWCVVA